MNKVLIVTNIAPLYRKALWIKLLYSLEHSFHFVYGRNDGSGIKEIDFTSQVFEEKDTRLHETENVYYNRKYLIWQKGVVNKCLSGNFQSIIFLGDYSTLSTWIGAILSRLRGVKVSFWSHGFYGNENSIKKVIRKLFFSLANSHLLYERRGKQIMISEGFKANNLHVIFNSLNYEQSFALRNNTSSISKEVACPFFYNNSLPLLIFVGRLTKVKKLGQLLEAVRVLNKSKTRINLLIIGDGKEQASLSEFVFKHSLQSSVHFYGPCYSEEKLSELISAADLCVSPGNVGLTAVHSLSYGTPVCTHGNFNNQMPESGAIEDGITGVFFEENDINSLVESVDRWMFRNPESRESIRKKCYKVIDDFYNPKYQLEVIENMLNKKEPFI